MLELCLPDDSLPEPLRPGVMGSDADLETRRAIASALHVRATSRTAVALARVTAESAAASASSLHGDGDAAADGLLHAAERDAALAVALRAGGTAASSLDVDADSSGDVAAACASRRAHAILLLLLGRLTDAATQLGQPAATGRAGNGARPTASRACGTALGPRLRRRDGQRRRPRVPRRPRRLARLAAARARCGKHRRPRGGPAALQPLLPL